jgi:osmotically inducible lipoprotein OsmB
LLPPRHRTRTADTHIGGLRTRMIAVVMVNLWSWRRRRVPPLTGKSHQQSSIGLLGQIGRAPIASSIKEPRSHVTDHLASKRIPAMRVDQMQDPSQRPRAIRRQMWDGGLHWPVTKDRKRDMKKIVVIAIVALTATACGHTNGTRAVTGGLIGAGGGAAIGGATGVGAGTGALIGGAGGAGIGALTTPNKR